MLLSPLSLPPVFPVWSPEVPPPVVSPPVVLPPEEVSSLAGFFLASSMSRVLAPSFSALRAAFCTARDATCSNSIPTKMLARSLPGINWMFTPLMLMSLLNSAAVAAPSLVSWRRNLPNSPKSICCLAATR